MHDETTRCSEGDVMLVSPMATTVPPPTEPPILPIPGIELPEVEPGSPLETPESPDIPVEPVTPDRELEPA